MRLISSVAGLATIFCLAVSPSFAATPPTPKSSHSQILIVFKDGHRQSFNLADIDRIEFPLASTPIAAGMPASPSLPSRAHFVGKWEVGDGMGSTFTITLDDNGDAWKSLNHVRGHWVYVDGEA
ncbi:MAG: hypothetical protein ABR991_02090, partial [Terracidiphilus sp.]